MAVTARPKLDAHKLRADFPVFEHPIHGKPLAFLDSAVTSPRLAHEGGSVKKLAASSASRTAALRSGPRSAMPTGTPSSGEARTFAAMARASMPDACGLETIAW